MMINPLVQLLGVEFADSMPGLPTADGASKGLFAALFGEQQAALLAETTGAPVLLWPDGTLSAVIEGEPIPPGALLVLPDGTQLTAFAEAKPDAPTEAVPLPVPTDDEPAVETSPEPIAMPVPGQPVETAAVPAKASPEAVLPQESGARAVVTAAAASAESTKSNPTAAKPATATVEAAAVKPPVQATTGSETARSGAVPAGFVMQAEAAESVSVGRQGGAGAFAASVFAAQSARLEAGLARDAVRVLAAPPAADGDPAPQSFARTDAVRPVGESMPLTGQTLPPHGTAGLDGRQEASAMRAGLMAERPTLQTLGDFTVRAVRVLANEGEHSMTVRLVPESLGELKLTVRTAGDSVHVHVVAASVAVRDALDGQMQGLRDALSREGIDLARVTVGSDTPGQHASARHSGAGPNASQGNGSSGVNADHSLEGERQGLATAYRAAPRDPDAMLDLFA